MGPLVNVRIHNRTDVYLHGYKGTPLIRIHHNCIDYGKISWIIEFYMGHLLGIFEDRSFVRCLIFLGVHGALVLAANSLACFPLGKCAVE